MIGLLITLGAIGLWAGACAAIGIRRDRRERDQRRAEQWAPMEKPDLDDYDGYQR